MKFKSIVSLLLISVSFTSCIVSKDYINNISKNRVLQDLKNKNIIVTTTDNISLKSFEKTFGKNYESNIDFANKFSSKLADELINNAVFAKVQLDEVNKWNVLNNGINTTNLAKLESLIINRKTDYILLIDNYNVFNRIESNYVGSTGFNNMGGAGHYQSSEYCVIEADIIIYDAVTKERIITFQTTGESSVFLFDFTNTFEKAKERSIIHAINYLKTGKIKYTKY